MTSDAYQKLAKLGLPYPSISSLEDVLSESTLPDDYFFLRTKKTHNLPKYANKQYFVNNYERMLELIHNGILMQIEPGILSKYGGCVLNQSGYTYIELVIGHLSGLLLNGWCSQRSLFFDTEFKQTSINQAEMVEIDYQNHQIKKSRKIDRPQMEKLARNINHYMRNIDKYLLEFIVDYNDNIFFVDYKDYVWQMDFEVIFDNKAKEGNIYTGGDTVGFDESTSDLFTGRFMLESLDRVHPNTILVLNNNALISHFVTYSLRNGLSTIIK